MPEMDFDVKRAPDGTIHVQDKVGAFLGQHHVHSKAGFETWEKKRKLGGKISIVDEPCPCSLVPGFVRECNGKTWFNAAFGDVQGVPAQPQPKEPSPPESGSSQSSSEPPISNPPESAPEPVARDAKKPKGKKELPQVKGAKGEKMKFTATATVEGKKQTHEFEHDKASPWKIKAFAASKFFAALVKDKSPLDVWKAIKIDPIRAKVERKEKVKKNGKKAEAKKD